MLAYLRTSLGHLSRAMAAFAAHRLIQLGVLFACVRWLALGRGENALASTLTIGGLILTRWCSTSSVAATKRST